MQLSYNKETFQIVETQGNYLWEKRFSQTCKKKDMALYIKGIFTSEHGKT